MFPIMLDFSMSILFATDITNKVGITGDELVTESFLQRRLLFLHPITFTSNLNAVGIQ